MHFRPISAKIQPKNLKQHFVWGGRAHKTFSGYAFGTHMQAHWHDADPGKLCSRHQLFQYSLSHFLSAYIESSTEAKYRYSLFT